MSLNNLLELFGNALAMSKYASQGNTIATGLVANLPLKLEGGSETKEFNMSTQTEFSHLANNENIGSLNQIYHTVRRKYSEKELV